MPDLWTGRRTLWVCLQFCMGVLNAYMMVWNLYDGNFAWAAFGVTGVIATARWRLPAATKPK